MSSPAIYDEQLERFAPITSAADVEAVEHTPLSARIAFRNTYDLVQRSARRYGDKLAFIHQATGDVHAPTRSLSYTQLGCLVTHLANELSLLGVGRTDAVGLLFPNVPEFFGAFVGASTVGVAAPINGYFESLQIRGHLAAIDANVVLAFDPRRQSEAWTRLTNALDGSPVQIIALMQDPEAGPLDEALLGQWRLQVPSKVELIALPSAPDSPELLPAIEPPKPQDAAAYFNTGGTTGQAKIAVQTQMNHVFMGWSLSNGAGVDETARLICGLPVFHVNAVFVTGFSPIMAGATVILLGDAGYRTPGVVANLWALIDRHRATFFSGVLTLYAALLSAPADGCDLSSLRTVGCGAAPMPAELFQIFERTFPVTIVEGYGLTEGTTCSTVNPPAGIRKIGSVGLRMPYQQVITAEITDGAISRFCATNEVGSVLIKGPSVFKGYLDPVANKRCWVGEDWLDTGDLGRFDQDGYLWLTGRTKDLIIRGGHNIDPAMIEDAMVAHPAVALAAAVGRPDAYAGEVPVVYVTLKPGMSVESSALISFARERVPERAAVPQTVTVIDHMPVTPVGKILKPPLRVRTALEVVRELLVAMDARAELDAEAAAAGLVVRISDLEGTSPGALRAKAGAMALRLEFC